MDGKDVKKIDGGSGGGGGGGSKVPVGRNKQHAIRNSVSTYASLLMYDAPSKVPGHEKVCQIFNYIYVLNMK